MIDARVGLEKYNQMGNFFSAFGIAEYTENRNDVIVFGGVLADGTPNTKEVYWAGVGPDGVDYGVGYLPQRCTGACPRFCGGCLLGAPALPDPQLPAPGQWFRQHLHPERLCLVPDGQRVWLSTDYSGYDPENSSSPSGSNVDGFAGFTYPAVQSYLFTLNVGF